MDESPSYHAETYSKSPSPAASNTSAASQTAKKRTRASKPKVRTGCITWYVGCPEILLSPISDPLTSGRQQNPACEMRRRKALLRALHIDRSNLRRV
ncbi:hypothetical protein B0H67DRAFT_246968 [Lasiosphaeris hirsuta]|uniref:Uncharacterized protein n=1 Tax=Lasiosphaeris hirsuta TaxID=260670 RepID=A0AA40DU57_9PEZI|nr:hypothetical protein B0H67DRAFT_246968 [Lasiosphaeris hirsuta]